jgi:signal transduction histidine kinase
MKPDRLAFLEVPTTDPDDSRRRRLLNIVLVVLTTFSLITVPIALISPEASTFLAALGVGLALANGIIYLINRYLSGQVASAIFLVLLSLIICFGDEPAQVVQGRTLFFLSVPIVASSILMQPKASFWVSGLISVLTAYLAINAGLPLNIVAMLGFFTLASISWLSARTLENAVREVRVINRELDERVEARTSELAEANERLLELDQLKSKFVSDVSHELRTPVSNLMIYMDILELENRPEQRASYLSVLREETNRLTQLVNDVLDISHLDLGVYRNTLAQKIDLNELIEDLVSGLSVRADVLGLKLEVDLTEEPTPISGTKEQVTRVVTNLLGNAIKYTQKGGIHVKTWHDDGCVVLEIEDTGMGIAPQDLDHVYERFYRGENVSQSTIPGTGLGLAIAYEIIMSLGGNIRIESELGSGTTVTVSLPSSGK